MADQQDIKDLENVASLANTDELLAIVAGLGRNYNWAKMKEQLVKELPVATGNSNGLMSAEYFRMHIMGFYTNNFTPNQKIGTGMTQIGLYMITDASGHLGLIGINSYTIPAFYIGGINFLSDGTNQGFLITRDQNDGEIFVTNKYHATMYFTMNMI